MEANSINTELDKYISLLTPQQKELVVQLIKSFVKPKDLTTCISIEQYNQEIAEAMEEAKKGNYITQEDLERDSASW